MSIVKDAGDIFRIVETTWRLTGVGREVASSLATGRVELVVCAL